MTKELDISIGDFGVATVMNDARTRTRTTVGAFLAVASEQSQPASRDIPCHGAGRCVVFLCLHGH